MPRRRVLRTQPRLETLEDRTLLSTVIWTGAAGDNNWDTAGNWSTSSAPTASDDVQINNGTVNLNHAATVNSLTTGSGTVLTLSGGLTINAGSSISGSVELKAGTLLLEGGGSSSGGTWLADPGTVLDFESNFSFDASSSITANSAQVAFDGGGTNTVACPYVVTSSATTGIGDTETSSGTVVDFTGGVNLAGSNLSVAGGTVDFRQASLLSPLSFYNVSLGGIADIFSNADLHITNQISAPSIDTFGGTGTVYFDGGMAADPNYFGNQLFLDCNLVNKGYTVLSAYVYLGSGVTLTNAAAATLETQDDDSIMPQSGATGEQLVNDGTLLRTTTGYYDQNNYIAVPFVNGPTGTVHVEANTLTFANTVQASGTAGTTTFLADPGTSLTFEGPVNLDSSTSVVANTAEFDAATTVAGSYTAGLTYVHSGSVAFTGGVNLAGSNLSVAGGTVDFRQASLLSPLSFYNVSLGGIADIFSNADLHITNQISAPSIDTFGGTGTVYFDGGTAADPNYFGNQLFLDCNLVNKGYTVLSADVYVGGGVTFVNGGLTAWTGGTVSFSGDSSFTNTAAGTFNDEIDGTFGSGDGMCQYFYNQGTFIKSGGNGVTYLQMMLNNSGLVDIEQGTLDIGCGYTQGSGGSISGNVSGSISNPGQIISGPSSNPPPVLSSYTQTATGTLDEQIGGLTAGTQYGQIIVTGSVNLAGTLEVSLVKGFTPSNGNQFIIIDNQGGKPVNGTFTSLAEGATVWDTTHTYRFLIGYVGGEGDDVVLTAQQTATTTTLTASANPSALNQPVSFTATVTPTAGSGTPTGTVQFQIDGGNAGAPVSLNGGKASFSTSTLTVGAHTITALYSGDSNLLGSSGSLTQGVRYDFSGFLPPVGNGLSFGVNRTIPIQFQLTDANGKAITSLSAVASLQIQALDANGNPVGAPFTPTSTNKQGLQYSGGEYQFNWQTKGLAAGSYEIVLKLADGTTHTVTIQLTVNGNGANAQATDGSDVSGDTAGQLLGGNVELYVDNSNGDLAPDELARIQDAVNAVDTTIAPYDVTITEVTDPTQANVTLNMGTSSAVGGYANGILGCYTTAGSITLIQGWDWYAGADPAQIGANQYDFQTTVTHELGHALGLGESSNPTSAMYGTLSAGTTLRTLTTADLNIPYDEGPADAQKAAMPAASAAADPVVGNSVASSRGMTAPSNTSAPNSGSPMSLADQLFADLVLVLSDARNGYPSGLSSVAALWELADASALQSIETLLSIEAGAMGLMKDSLMRDSLFASSLSSSGT